MKLTLERAALLKALDPACRIVERRTTIPILAHIRLAEEDGALTLTATDLDIELQATIPAEIATPGLITVPAARLLDIARKLPEGCQITLEAKDDTRVELKSGRSRFQLNTLPASDFPDITAGEMSCSFSMPAQSLASIVAACQFAISTDETRYFLNGIHLHLVEEDGAAKIAAVATDGHRLARIHVPAPEGSAGMPPVIVPRKTVAEIARLVDKSKAEIAVSLSRTKIRLGSEGFTLNSKLIDGTFPDYRRVIPAGNDKSATLDAQAFAAAAERVAAISGERGRAVKLALSEGMLVLSVTNPDSGEAREELDCDYEGGPIDIGFNARYLGDILGMLGGDTVLLKLADPGAPAILQSHEGSETLTVLMPMRV